MVQIFSYLRHYQFEHGLRMLEKGYTAARDALQADIERTKAEAIAYEKHLANGGEWIGEFEDGHILWEQSQIYEAEINDVELALLDVRKAFIIALYHYWEHSATAWKGSYGSHHELAQFCASEGYGPSPELDAVRYLANYLKHGPKSRTDWLDRLRRNYPTFMPKGPVEGLFGLSDESVFKVAAIIFASGPTTKEQMSPRNYQGAKGPTG